MLDSPIVLLFVFAVIFGLMAVTATSKFTSMTAFRLLKQRVDYLEEKLNRLQQRLDEQTDGARHAPP